MTDLIPYPAVLKIFRQRYKERDVLFEIMDQLPDYSPHLQTASTCLSIGTGYGEYDIEFIRKCLPNLKKFIAVEVDDKCVEELKVNLSNQFCEDLDVEIYQMSFEKFMDLYENVEKNFFESSEKIKIFNKLFDRKIDVILAFHVIHFLNEQNRKRFYKICFEEWLTPGKGRLIFTTISNKNSIHHLLKHLESRPYATSETMKSELNENKSSKLVKEVRYNCPMDLSSYDIDLPKMFNFAFSSGLNVDYIMQAIKIIVPTGWGIFDADFGIYETIF